MTANHITHSVPSAIKKAFTEASQYFPSPMQMFQFFDKYSRFNYDLGRRETWVETTKRAVDYLRELSDNKLDEKDYQRINDYMWHFGKKLEIPFPNLFMKCDFSIIEMVILRTLEQ